MTVTCAGPARFRDPAGEQKVKVFDRRVDAERFLATVEASTLTGAGLRRRGASSRDGSPRRPKVTSVALMRGPPPCWIVVMVACFRIANVRRTVSATSGWRERLPTR